MLGSGLCGMNLMCSFMARDYQIFGFVVLQMIILTSGRHEEATLVVVDPEETVLINFPKKLNDSRGSARHLYLPPDEPNFILPEVIDNRVRSPLPRPTVPPSGELKAPGKGELGRDKFSGHSGIAKRPKDLEGQSTMRITSMSCKNAEDGAHFRASLIPLKFRDAPVVEGTASDSCRIERNDGEFRIDFTGDLFWNCGVEDCSTESGKFYCLNLRFPAITGLRMKEDTKVLLRCRMQERTASHTKKFNIKTLDTFARMAPRIATGGHRNKFETDVGLYRKTFGSDHLFDVKIQPGGTVILGEEILLRVVVRDGDGWKYSRLSDISISYIENKRRKKFMNSVWILDSNGCLNPDVNEISSREQYRVTPLETYLIFQAFAFEGMKETDELILSVKVTGCLDGSDCILNCPGSHVRKTRSLASPHNQTIDWLNDISFRVISSRIENRRLSNENHMIVPYILSALILAAAVALLLTIKVLKNQKRRDILIN